MCVLNRLSNFKYKPLHLYFAYLSSLNDLQPDYVLKWVGQPKTLCGVVFQLIVFLTFNMFKNVIRKSSTQIMSCD